MKKIIKNKSLKPFVLSILLAVLLIPTMSCVSGSESNLIESILNNIDGVDGEATVHTEDGRTITVTVRGDTQTNNEQDTEKNTQNDDEKESTSKKTDDNKNELGNILPTLNCIEDAFKTLGLWDKASELREQGMSWSHVAEELGLDRETMYRELQDDIEKRLRHARELGLINQEQFEYKIKYYGELAEKWVNKIFADTGNNNSADLASMLPSLNSIEDVFKTLELWDKASELYKNGLSWSEVATELGLNEEIMCRELQDSIEARLHHARELGLINQEQFEYKYGYYNELALKWVNKIFES